MPECCMFGVHWLLGEIVRRRGYLVVASQAEVAIGAIVPGVEVGTTAGNIRVDQPIRIVRETDLDDCLEQSKLAIELVPGATADRGSPPLFYYRVITD